MTLPIRRRLRRALPLGLILASLMAAPLAAAPLPQGVAEAVAAAPSRERVRMNVRVFDTVWNAVRRQYYDPDLHGVDWRAARAVHRPRAAAAIDDHQLYRSLSAMLDLLDDDHAGAVSPAVARRQDALRTRRPVLGVALMREGGDLWRIDAVREGSPAEAAGVEPGWLLQRVDGQSWGVDFDVEEGRPVRLDLTDHAGAPRQVSVTPRVMDPLPAFTADTSRPGVVVLRVEGFEAGLGQWLGERLRNIPADTDIVIDMRGNPGGLLLEADAALSCFLPPDRPWATRISRAGRPVVLSVMSSCGDLGGPVANDVALLVDGSSRSAAELTPQALQEAGRALVVGETTAGSVLISQETRLPDGGRLSLSRADYVTSAGVRLEKRGVTPDLQVVRSPEDRRAGRDPALEAAIEALALPPEEQRALAAGFGL